MLNSTMRIVRGFAFEYGWHTAYCQRVRTLVLRRRSSNSSSSTIPDPCATCTSASSQAEAEQADAETAETRNRQKNVNYAILLLPPHYADIQRVTAPVGCSSNGEHLVLHSLSQVGVVVREHSRRRRGPTRFTPHIAGKISSLKASQQMPSLSDSQPTAAANACTC